MNIFVSPNYINMNAFSLENIFTFLVNLDRNNNREWFAANKPQYEQAKSEFAEYVTLIGKEIEKIDSKFNFSHAKDYTFRIYRDVRFSHNKSPYKNNFGAFFSIGGRKSPYAGYYLHIQPGATFFGGGIYRPEKEILNAVRQEVYYSYKEFRKVLDNKEFKKVYPELLGDKLVNGPKDFPKDCEAIDLLKYKSIVVSHAVSESELKDKSFSKHLLHGFELLLPLNQLLNTAIELKSN